MDKNGPASSGVCSRACKSNLTSQPCMLLPAIACLLPLWCQYLLHRSSLVTRFERIEKLLCMKNGHTDPETSADDARYVSHTVT